jgi:tyrosine-protein phosphatase SIW14
MIRYYLHSLILVVAFLSVPIGAKGAADPVVSGIPNFHQVNGNIYRGGQPTAQGWISLKRLGVKTVIDLRRDGKHSTKAEERAVEAAGMHYVNVPMRGVVAPRDETVFKVLALLESRDAGPLFVHCRRGKDRTGTIIACYRIAHDGWPNQKALEEAKSYGMHWYEFGLKRYVLRFSPPPQKRSSRTCSEPGIGILPVQHWRRSSARLPAPWRQV